MAPPPCPEAPLPGSDARRQPPQVPDKAQDAQSLAPENTIVASLKSLATAVALSVEELAAVAASSVEEVKAASPTEFEAEVVEIAWSVQAAALAAAVAVDAAAAATAAALAVETAATAVNALSAEAMQSPSLSAAAALTIKTGAVAAAKTAALAVKTAAVAAATAAALAVKTAAAAAAALAAERTTAGALKSALHDKEALIREVHHRVKNNLQVITSLLRLEGGRASQVDTKTVLAAMQGRIRCMALLHESLYRSGTLASVDLGHYLKQIATQSFQSMQTPSSSVRLQLDLGSVDITMDQAAPCGLLVNELVSNCLKHAFPHPGRQELSVSLQSVGDGARWRLRVSDTGVGLPADFEERRKTSLGLQLVDDLNRQLGGSLEIGPGAPSGTVFTVTFAPERPA